MSKSEWFTGAMDFFGGDDMVGETVVVIEKVFREVGGARSGHVMINGYLGVRMWDETRYFSLGMRGRRDV